MQSKFLYRSEDEPLANINAVHYRQSLDVCIAGDITMRKDVSHNSQNSVLASCG
jgi:hypothetical protein